MVTPNLTANLPADTDVIREKMPNLLNTISYSDATLSTRDISESIESHTSNPPMPTSTFKWAPISTLKTTPRIDAKRAKASHRKAPKKPKTTRRSGPLDARVREKAEEMRDIGACWRCRKYKKPVCMLYIFHLLSANIPG
jgi:hypothetical protein